MISSYFVDLVSILLDVHSKLRKDGRIFMAVGSSKYAGIFIDVPRIIVELATRLALVLVDNSAIRSMRASAQQGGKKELRESLIVLA
jgi:hypothetical protein